MVPESQDAYSDGDEAAMSMTRLSVALVLAGGAGWLCSWCQAQPSSPEHLSDADRIAKLQTLVEQDAKQLATLQAKLENPQSEYRSGHKALEEIDKQVRALEAELDKRKDSAETESLTKLKKELEIKQKERKTAHDRYNLAIEERRTMMQAVKLLQEKLQQNKNRLAELLGGAPRTPPTVSERKATPPPPKTSPPADEKPTEPAKSLPIPGLPMVKGSKNGEEGPTKEMDEDHKDQPESEALRKARALALEKETQAESAQTKLVFMKNQIDSIKKEIELVNKLIDTERKQIDTTQKMVTRLGGQLQDKLKQKAPIDTILQQIDKANANLRQAYASRDRYVERVAKLHYELEELQDRQISVLRDVQTSMREAEESKQEVKRLEDPLAPENLLNWVVAHVPNIVLIVLGTFGLRYLAHNSSARVVRLMARSHKNMSNRGSAQDRENRIRTLTSVFASTASLLILGGGIMMVLDELGVPIMPLLGGAAILGLAVAFGAQSLIKDYFSGFMILVEDQYGINDVVKIGDIPGQVENITLRVTVLRDLDGIVHFIPHGQIATVSNMTHGWSRALFDIGVAYKEDIDFVIEVLMELASELRYDKHFGALILEDAEMLGVDKFDASAIVIRFFIKTCPLQQWTVRRELLRRIKRRFDELGIEIPYPHRTIYLRNTPEVVERLRAGGEPLQSNGPLSVA